MCSLRFENNLLTIEGVRFASISKKTPISKLSFAFVSLALPLLSVWADIGAAVFLNVCSTNILAQYKENQNVSSTTPIRLNIAYSVSWSKRKGK
jgi:hypothetical protein